MKVVLVRVMIIPVLTLAFSLDYESAHGQAGLGSRGTATGDSERYGYEFEDDPLNAGGFGPNDATIRVRPKPARTTLIRPRTTFVPEMLKSVENLLRFDKPSSLSMQAISPSFLDREGFLESETFIYIDHNGDGRWPYGLDDTAFHPSDPDVYIWNLTGLDWFLDRDGNAILDGAFSTNLAIRPPAITLKLLPSEWQADFLANTLPPESHLDSLPFELTLNFGLDGGASTWSSNGVIWALPELDAAAVPEPSTFVLGALGLAGLALAAWWRRK